MIFSEDMVAMVSTLLVKLITINSFTPQAVGEMNVRARDNDTLLEHFFHYATLRYTTLH